MNNENTQKNIKNIYSVLETLTTTVTVMSENLKLLSVGIFSGKLSRIKLKKTIPDIPIEAESLEHLAEKIGEEFRNTLSERWVAELDLYKTLVASECLERLDEERLERIARISIMAIEQFEKVKKNKKEVSPVQEDE